MNIIHLLYGLCVMKPHSRKHHLLAPDKAENASYHPTLTWLCAHEYIHQESSIHPSFSTPVNIYIYMCIDMTLYQLSSKL